MSIVTGMISVTLAAGSGHGSLMVLMVAAYAHTGSMMARSLHSRWIFTAMSLVKIRPKFRAFRRVLREKTIVAVVLSGWGDGVCAMEVLMRCLLLCLIGL